MEIKKTNWVIDPTHSEFTFKVKHMMISTVTGQFEKFDTKVETNDNDFTNATIDVKVDIDSINTNNKDRDNHLKSNDFFSAEKFPVLSFKSKKFEGDKLVGDLTIRDVTNEITLDSEFNGIAVDPWGNTKAGFELTGEINRKDFGLMWDVVTEAGNVVVSNKIKLAMSVQLVKRA